MKEQIYNDFVTNMLPKIQEGFTITYDYFIDLFGRYVTYLLVTDIIMLVVTVVITIILCYGIYRAIKWLRNNGDFDYGLDPLSVLLLFPIACAIFAFFIALEIAQDVVKDIYIPEVRVYEEMQRFTN